MPLFLLCCTKEQHIFSFKKSRTNMFRKYQQYYHPKMLRERFTYLLKCMELTRQFTNVARKCTDRKAQRQIIVSGHQADTFCNERSVLIHKSSLSGINKKKIKICTFCLYLTLSKKVLFLEHNRRKHYLLIYSNKVRLSNVFHPSCGICAVYYQYWLLKPRSQLSAKCSAVTWVLSSKLSMSL